MTAEPATARQSPTRVPASCVSEERCGVARARRAALRLLVPAVAVSAATTGGGVAGAAADNGVSKMSADAIVSASEKATQSATSFTLNGTVKNPSATTTFENDSMSQSGDARGTLVVNGQPLRVIVAGGTVYLNGSAAFWKVEHSNAGSLIGGKWLYDSHSNQGFSEFGERFNPQWVTQNLFSSISGATFAKAGTTTVNGKRAIRVNGRSGSREGSLYVAATGNPYVLREIDPSGSVNFSAFDQPVHTAPPANALDFAQLQG